MPVRFKLSPLNTSKYNGLRKLVKILDYMNYNFLESSNITHKVSVYKGLS